MIDHDRLPEHLIDAFVAEVRRTLAHNQICEFYIADHKQRVRTHFFHTLNFKKNEIENGLILQLMKILDF